MKPTPFPFALFIPMLILAGFIVVGYYALEGRFHYAPPSAAAAPALRLPQYLPGSDMKTFKLESLRGEKVLVNFFASWCVPCVAELPVLKGIAQGHALAIIGVAYNDREIDVGRFLDKYGNAYARVVRDPSGSAAIDWGVTGVPESFLIDEKGAILVHHSGPLSPEIWDAEFEKFFSTVVK